MAMVVDDCKSRKSADLALILIPYNSDHFAVECYDFGLPARKALRRIENCLGDGAWSDEFSLLTILFNRNDDA